MSSGESKFRYSPDYLLRKMDSKNNVKNSLIKTGANVVLGVGAGTVGTCFMGKWGFLAGLGFIGLGCYKDISWAVPLGIGMSASALMLAKEQYMSGVEGFDLNTQISRAKARLSALHDSFMEKSLMHKIFPDRAEKKPEGKQLAAKEETRSEEVNGLGEDPVSEKALQDIEKQLVASAMEYHKKQNAESPKQVEGTNEDDLMGLGEEDFSSM